MAVGEFNKGSYVFLFVPEAIVETYAVVRPSGLSKYAIAFEQDKVCDGTENPQKRTYFLNGKVSPVCQNCYFRELGKLMSTLTRPEYPKFLEYQKSIHHNPLDWLKGLQKFIDVFREDFNAHNVFVYSSWKDVIDQEIYNLEEERKPKPSTNREDQNKQIETASKLQYEVFHRYLKEMTYNYPYRRSAFDFKYTMRDFLGYLKSEILENLIVLGKDERKPYLNKLKFEIAGNRQHAYISEEDLGPWLEKYEYETEDDVQLRRGNNDLFYILSNEPPTMDEEFEDGFNRDIPAIQKDFYNYYYGVYIEKAISFIDEQITELDPEAKSMNNNARPRLKTNLSVPELAYLFKLLMDLNPAIFNFKYKTEVYRFIEANFITKGKDDEGPTVFRLNNLYSDVDPAVAKFWAERLAKMLQEARKV